MTQYRGYLIDLDGTVYQGKTQIPAAQRFIARLQENEIPFLFVTNNTTKKPAEVVANLAHNHNIYVQEANVYTAGMATAEYLQDDAEQRGLPLTVNVIGEPDLKSLISQAGFDVFANNPAYVVAALDYDLTYEKIAQAALDIQKGARFIGTNADTLIPTERGKLPGAGSIIDLLRYATQVDPVLIGKPNDLIIKNAIKLLQLPADQVVMVGDNYQTDIKAGMKAGIDTLLVYTGVSKRDQVQKEDRQPTHEIESFDDWQI
ncbi:TIGR01457 family HAD-type hydrolase [Fructilactobacillus carniphilus]|uniref:TIGR01457 family HAD-type hydrolase n=1 Tax=Fructilactobacillus carniphilus TaxID=2940297 RepID=A0ABY5C0S5_9LACO|nr:TIGR01457 family HAD-type hydrolase [Fructilactobacillus carniphilus]USS91218.1 TIGR01457 family HAD-type hydrolase [Fructilactobacillus carniphilus]